MPRGRFITLEGGEGAGKSTQARLLKNTLSKLLSGSLAADGIRVLQTREPGGAPGAEAIRGVLLGSGPWDGISECMLHFAARREHVVRTIRPALEAGIWVVCDRFVDSTMAYQVFGQGVPREVFDSLAKMTLEGLTPDLTLMLDIGPEEGLTRATARGETNRYEALDPDFHARVRAGFRAIAAAEPARCAVVDATAAPEGVAAEILRIVRARLAP
ncbi:dTMP kinase [Roseicella aerolata]|uniref:Thymidylate kinase n=1 Tax=Roseicella aerolata TaxID=2883479 RepID=A0A9X1IE62_9PROT|nr:dTMP kinase [Roseicella aerolata]MCB4821653.1 dTMP kinase [Roseicella aerolata]